MRRAKKITQKVMRAPAKRMAIAVSSFLVALSWGVLMPELGADARQNEALPYKPEVFGFRLLLEFLEDPKGEKLYCVGYDPPSQGTLEGENRNAPGRSILTRWNLDTGKCERIEIKIGLNCFIQDISPNGSWIVASYINGEKVAKFLEAKKNINDLKPEDLDVFSAFVCTERLRPIHNWSRLLTAWPNSERVHWFFLQDDRFGFLIRERQDAKSKRSYLLSLWRIEHQLREELRVPLTGLDEYSILQVEAKGSSSLALLATDLASADAQSVRCYLLIYNFRNKAIITKYDLGNVQFEERPDEGKILPISVMAWNNKGSLALVKQGNQYLLCDLATPPRVIEPAHNFAKEPISPCAMSPDGKLIAFGFLSTRVVLYHVDEKKYRVFDTTLENMLAAWDNPPFGSPLWQMVRHPLVAQLMPLLKIMVKWRHIAFLGNGDRLIGVTTYGKVIIWDVKHEKIVNSFRIVEPGFDKKIGEILGLD